MLLTVVVQTPKRFGDTSRKAEVDALATC